mmetsp:Transcript_5676/g.11006  ORF Transcript_5676/g.11006 Transcript_5676/m.11006 type:complete len:356 (+) Transcript_5676:497-1564(+)
MRGRTAPAVHVDAPSRSRGARRQLRQQFLDERHGSIPGRPDGNRQRNGLHLVAALLADRNVILPHLLETRVQADLNALVLERAQRSSPQLPVHRRQQLRPSVDQYHLHVLPQTLIRPVRRAADLREEVAQLPRQLHAGRSASNDGDPQPPSPFLPRSHPRILVGVVKFLHVGTGRELERLPDGRPQSLRILTRLEIEAVFLRSRDDARSTRRSHGDQEVIVVEFDDVSGSHPLVPPHRSVVVVHHRGQHRLRIEAARSVARQPLERARDRRKARELHLHLLGSDVDADGAPFHEVIDVGVRAADGFGHAAVFDGADGGRCEHGREYEVIDGGDDDDSQVVGGCQFDEGVGCPSGL